MAPQSAQVAFVLHSHLPYYRKAGRWPSGEENLYECVLETYLPLLEMLSRLQAEGIKAPLSIGLTPILVEQLQDAYIQQGIADYLQTKLSEANADIARFENGSPQQKLARHYWQHISGLITAYETTYQRDLVGAFAQLQQAGCIELLASAATHAFLPLLSSDESIQRQIEIGCQNYQESFGQTPKGFWLPECAYRPTIQEQEQERPGLEHFLEKAGLQYFVSEYHSVERDDENGIHPGSYATPDSPDENGPTHPDAYLPESGTHRPYRLADSSLCFMARNREASFQVWSGTYGYPGDSVYREFHKADDQSGLKYWKLTDKARDLGFKEVYNLESAHSKAHEHAKHYVSLLRDLAKQAAVENPVLLMAFDTELFGHWWYEGPIWLEAVLRELASSSSLTLHTTSNILTAHTALETVPLHETTWGQGGHYWIWNNNQTQWMWEKLAQCDAQVQGSKIKASATLLTQRVYQQATRELLLLQASDWPFLVTTYQAKEYATQRFNEHAANIDRLVTMLENDSVDEAILEALEAKNNCFGQPSLATTFALTPSFESACQN